MPQTQTRTALRGLAARVAPLEAVLVAAPRRQGRGTRAVGRRDALAVQRPAGRGAAPVVGEVVRQVEARAQPQPPRARGELPAVDAAVCARLGGAVLLGVGFGHCGF